MVLSAPLAAPRSWVPRLPEPVVERPRLDVLLAEDRRRQVTLVAAPPGAGKTTLLAGWVRRTYNLPVAWLTVEPADNRSHRFTRSVIDALAGIGAVTPRDLRTIEDPVALIDVVLDELSFAGRRTALVLDDVQELTTRGAVAALGRLAERAPQELGLLIASRADPPLRLGRLRAEGRLGEVRHADLRFTIDETAELFEVHGLHLAPRTVLAIHERTEGWAAGLRLIAYAIENGADPRRFGEAEGPAEEAVSEYLLTEVLERQDEAAKRFLQRTSIVDELTPELAIELCDDPDAASRLEDLERRGVFLSQLDGLAIYRYHSLFASLLRARLRHHDPTLSSQLHGRAARWYAARNMAGAAEHHARLSGDWTLLGEFLERRWLETTLGGHELGSDLVDGVPARAIGSTPALSRVAAAAAVAHGDRDGALQLVSSIPDGRDAEAHAVIGLLHTRAFGTVPGIDPDWSDGVNGSSEVALMRFAALCRAEIALDGPDLAAAQARLAELAEEEAGWTSVTARAFVALVDAIEGRLVAARMQAAAAIGHASGPGRQTVVDIAALATAIAEAQHGQRAVLCEQHGVALASHRALREVDLAVRAALSAALGTVRLDGKTARHPLSGRALVALGVLDVVEAKGARVPIGGIAESAVRTARGAQVVAAYGSIAELLEPWLSSHPDPAHPRTLVEASVLAAVASTAQGDPAQADAHLGRALAFAAPERLWAPLRAHGPALTSSLESLARSSGPHQAAAMVLLDEARQLQAPPFVDALTDQEHAVLRLLSTLMSNAEIASAMQLSVNTIKTHLKALYRKLGVERRRDAVVRARQLELL